MPDPNETKPSDESLRLEYKITHEKHDYYGKILWQMGSIFLPSSLAGFAFGVQQDLPLERFIPLNLVISALLVVFLFTAQRLRWLAFAYLQRGKEIEKELGLAAITKQQEANKKEIIIGGKTVKPQKITGRYLNQFVPISLLVIFWGYVVYKHLNDIGIDWNSIFVQNS